MKVSPRQPLALLVVVCALSATRAQEKAVAAPHRDKVLGWVEDGDGQRIAGATVTLLARPIPERADIGEADRIEVQSDERGLFRAEVLPGGTYTAWAQQLDDAGLLRVSGPAENVVPGPPVRLELGASRTPRRVRFDGLAAWQAHGPLSLHCRAITRTALLVPLMPGEEGIATLPELPGMLDQVYVEVRTADGLLVHFEEQSARGGDVAPLTIGPPREVRVVVRDDAGAAVPNASVAHVPNYAIGGRHPGMAPLVLGSTGPDGTFQATVPSTPFGARESQRPIFLIRAAGRAGVVQQLDDTDDLVVALPAGSSVHGRLALDAERPAPGVTAWIDTMVAVPALNQGRSAPAPMPIPTAADGGFRFDGLTEHGFVVQALLTAAHLEAAGVEPPKNRSLPPVSLLASTAAVSTDIDLGDLRIDRLELADVRVLRHDGTPAVHARFRVRLGDHFNLPVELHTDRLGRVLMPVPQGDGLWLDAYEPGGGVAQHFLAVAGEPGTLREIPITLSRPWEVTGVVVDESGEPVAHASVRFGERPGGLDFSLASLVFWSRMALGIDSATSTDSEGRFTLRAPLAGAGYSVRARWEADGQRLTGETAVLVEEAAQPPELRITLAPDRR